MSINSIVIIGTGNVATHLGIAFIKAGINIVGIVARDIEAGNQLAQRLANPPVYKLGADLPIADAYLIAVKDDAIREVALKIASKQTLLIHCSGATNANILDIDDNNFGVVWPMQTLTKSNEISLRQTLIAVNGNTPEIESAIAELMGKISTRIIRVTETQRQVMHMSAVWLNNYTNHMFMIAEHILAEHNLDLEMFHPLIDEHVSKLKTMPADQLQTGPAARGDMATLNKHMSLLNNHPDWKQLYDTLAQSIINQALKK